MIKYYLDLEYFSKLKGAYISYKLGAYNGLYFNTLEEASDYAKRNLFLISDNEVLSLYRVYNGEHAYITFFTPKLLY